MSRSILNQGEPRGNEIQTTEVSPTRSPGSPGSIETLPLIAKSSKASKEGFPPDRTSQPQLQPLPRSTKQSALPGSYEISPEGQNSHLLKHNAKLANPKSFPGKSEPQEQMSARETTAKEYDSPGSTEIHSHAEPSESPSENNLLSLQDDAQKSDELVPPSKPTQGPEIITKSGEGEGRRGTKFNVVTKEPREKRHSAKPRVTSIPQTNFTIGLLVACCFNLPLGVIAIYLALRAAAAYRDGEKDKGASRARMSILVSLCGITITMVVVSSLVVYFAVNKHSKRAHRPPSSSPLGF